MIATQLTHNDYRDLRVQLLLDSGQVPGISVQHQTLTQLYGQTQTPSSTPVNPLVQAIVQTFAQLGLTLPFSPDSSTVSTLAVSNTAASGPSQASNASTQARSVSAAGIDSAFEQFIGQILQAASSLQHGAASSLALQSDSGNQGNGTSATPYSNPLAQALESLAGAVNADSNQTEDASGDNATGSTTSLNQPVAGLTQDFNTLFGSSGTNNGASLQTFLKTFASNVAELSASGSSGTFVQTSA